MKYTAFVRTFHFLFLLPMLVLTFETWYTFKFEGLSSNLGNIGDVVFEAQGDFNGKPYWKSNNSDKDLYCFWSQLHLSWVVSIKLGDSSGILRVPHDAPDPLSADNLWAYSWADVWNQSPSIKIAVVKYPTYKSGASDLKWWTKSDENISISDDEEVHIPVNKWLESPKDYVAPFAIRAEIKSDDLMCATMSLFHTSVNNDDGIDISINKTHFSSKHGSFSEKISNSNDWHVIQISIRSNGSVHFYYQFEEMYIKPWSGSMNGTVAFISSCTGISIRKVRVIPNAVIKNQEDQGKCGYIEGTIVLNCGMGMPCKCITRCTCEDPNRDSPFRYLYLVVALAMCCCCCMALTGSTRMLKREKARNDEERTRQSINA